MPGILSHFWPVFCQKSVPNCRRYSKYSNSGVAPWQQWLTSGTVPDRYPVFFTCPTTRSIKIVCPTGIEFSKSSEAFPHAAKNCYRLAVWKSQSENFSRLAIVGNYILGIPAVKLRRRDSFLPQEDQTRMPKRRASWRIVQSLTVMNLICKSRF